MDDELDSDVTMSDWSALEEKVARENQPWVWSLDPPDISSSQARQRSLAWARRYIEDNKNKQISFVALDRDM